MRINKALKQAVKQYQNKRGLTKAKFNILTLKGTNIKSNIIGMINDTKVVCYKFKNGYEIMKR